MAYNIVQFHSIQNAITFLNMGITGSSVLRLKEEMKEHRIYKTLCDII